MATNGEASKSKLLDSHTRQGCIRWEIGSIKPEANIGALCLGWHHRLENASHSMTACQVEMKGCLLPSTVFLGLLQLLRGLTWSSDVKTRYKA